MVGSARNIAAILAESLLVWMSFGLVAVLMGGLREKLLVPRLGELGAHQVGTLVVCAVMALIITTAMRWIRPTARQALAIGGGWVLMTVLFELGVFRFAVGVPWEELLADYDVSRGRLWPLVLVTELAVPWAVARRGLPES